MNSLLQKPYTALTQGGLITFVLAIIVTNAGLVIITDAFASFTVIVIINILSFIICWLAISSLILKFSIYKIIALVSLLFAAALADHYIKIPDNPITIPFIILFWLGIAYLIIPQFFKKYKLPILTVYGLVISYYFISFLTTPDYGLVDRHNFSRFILFPLPVFAALWIYEQWRWLKTLQADKGKAELALLKSQINPHFFFNTLNNLYGLVVEKSEQAPDVVLKLSDMMRYTIYEGEEDEVLLTDEINYLENYIELHKIRYQNNIDIQFIHEIEEEIKVAPLLFIILLENAFKHGLEKVRDDAFIHLRMHAKDNQITFIIGNSYDPSASNKSPGIGLDNLRKRLEFLYPNRHQLIIDKNDSFYNVQLNLEIQ